MKHVAIILTLPISLAACAGAQQPEPKLAATAACESIPDASERTARYLSPAIKAKPIEPRDNRDFQDFQDFQEVYSSPDYGAKIHLPAQSGLSAPYLTRVLKCHAAGGQPLHNHDPLHPESGAIASVKVQEAATGYWVSIITNSQSTADEVYERAKKTIEKRGS